MFNVYGDDFTGNLAAFHGSIILCKTLELFRMECLNGSAVSS